MRFKVWRYLDDTFIGEAENIKGAVDLAKRKRANGTTFHFLEQNENYKSSNGDGRKGLYFMFHSIFHEGREQIGYNIC